ncbi:MAG TPA: hypothetical protein VLL07_00855, partial [Pontiella sp.]|nr:hypothetical protein [Pontiella sp.]
MLSLTRLLLEKDLKRISRNPMSMVILILIPFLITGLIGMTFGGMANGNGDGFAPIRLGIVDKDESVFSQF